MVVESARADEWLPWMSSAAPMWTSASRRPVAHRGRAGHVVAVAESGGLVGLGRVPGGVSPAW